MMVVASTSGPKGDGSMGAGANYPLRNLLALLPDESERDARWGARRQGERIPFTKPLALRRYEMIDAEEIELTFDGWALNVCYGGMRIITDEPLQPGDVVFIELESSGVPYTGEAFVRWVRVESDGVIAGLQFG
jgi:hypothetical protein